MGKRNNMQSTRRKNMRQKAKIVIWAFSGMTACIVLVILGSLFLKLHSATKDSVAIVKRPGQSVSEMTSEREANPSTPTDPANTTVLTETTLAPIEGTPSDIDVDYEPDVIDPSIEPIYEKSPLDQNIVNIIILSSDARPDEKGGRSDSIMLLSINRKMGQVKLVSFLRDSWVQIEKHGWNRINAAYSFGGVGLAINTVNDNFDLDIQNYVTIRFEQFITVIDQLGGISISLTKAEIEYINHANPNTPLGTKEGFKLLNGAQTLTHCRNRKVGNGDFDRTSRQRNTMMAIFGKLKQQRNPAVITKLLSTVLDNINTNLKAADIIKLAIETLGNQNLSIEEARVPFDKTWRYANEDGRSVIAIDIATNRTLLNQFLYR